VCVCEQGEKDYSIEWVIARAQAKEEEKGDGLE
jgi:hypothetical protein